MKTKYNIGDKLINTTVVGDCIIIDVYMSDISGEVVYKVKELSFDTMYLYTEDELEQQ